MSVAIFILVLLASSTPALSQTVIHGEGRSLADWLGVERGDPLHFERSDGTSVCAVVGPTRQIDDRAFVPLFGLPWPGLASDSQVLVPLDGGLGLDIIRTPGPRPHVDELLARPEKEVPFLETAPTAAQVASIVDGWYAFGGSPGEPKGLLHVWCGGCKDAGQRVWMERDRGITRVEVTTITGTESLRLVDQPCTPPEVEIRLYLEPDSTGS